MKFLKEFIVIALVLAVLLLAGCTNQANNGTPPGQNGQLLDSAVNPSSLSVDATAPAAGDDLLDISDLEDSDNLTPEDLQ